MTSANSNNRSSAQQQQQDPDAWTRAGRAFASTPHEIYTRSLLRLCLKFTTSEDEDEGKPEPGAAFWTIYGRQTTIGSAGPNAPKPDSICRRMDDSMSGAAAGVLSRISDQDGDAATRFALAAGLTTGWQLRGDRGDAAIRVGRAKIVNKTHVNLLSMDAERWVLTIGTSFTAGNSIFHVEEETKDKSLVLHCSKGPMKGKAIDVPIERCPFVFGRAHEADLCIMDRELSRKHGAILFVKSKRFKSGGAFVLVDLESTVSLPNVCCPHTRFLLSLSTHTCKHRMDPTCGSSDHTDIRVWAHLRSVMSSLSEEQASP